MNIQLIRQLANIWGISPYIGGKVELIRAMQREEGSFDCFAKAHEGFCDQADCLWREDCLALSARHSKKN